MKNLFLLLILVLTFSSCSRSRVVIADTEIPDDVFYLNEQMKPFTGECVIYFEGTEIVKEEMHYEDGILHGMMTSYYKDGTVKRKGSFIRGRMDGKWESWYKNGSRRYIANYSNDTLSGEYLEWYNTGVMKEKGLFAQNLQSGETANDRNK